MQVTNTNTKEIYEVIQYDNYKGVITLKNLRNEKLLSMTESHLTTMLRYGTFVV